MNTIREWKKPIAFAAALLAMLILLYQFGDSAFASVKSRKMVRSQELFSQYQRFYAGRNPDAPALLDAIRGLGLPPTPENISEVHRMIESSVPEEEKVALTRIYGRFHADSTNPEVKEQILRELSSFVKEPDAGQIGKSAAHTYSRLGFFPDSIDLLNSAKNSKMMTEKEYYADLVYFLSVAPPPKQSSIMDMLKASKNASVHESLAELLVSNAQMRDISSDVAAQAKDILKSGEPSFSKEPSEFVKADALRYEKWIGAMARLENQMYGKPEGAFLLEKLTRPDVDPRKIIAVLMSFESVALIRSEGGPQAIDRLKKIALDYSMRNGGGYALQQAVASVQEMGATPKVN
jgi:hypothetical protein